MEYMQNRITVSEEKVLEMRGMRRQEIIDYFLGLNDMDCHLSIFEAKAWRVEICEEVFVSIGKFRIPSTTVKFTGEKDFLDQAIYKFRLRFLTAGG